MFERFTDKARQAVVLAQEEAQTLKHNYLGTEHLLLGLLRDDGVAGNALASFDITLDETRDAVKQIVGVGDEVVTGRIPFTPRAKKVLELGMREAQALDNDYIGTEHLLLGIARDNEGVAARILHDCGADPDPIFEQVGQLLSRQISRDPAPPDTFADFPAMSAHSPEETQACGDEFEDSPASGWTGTPRKATRQAMTRVVSRKRVDPLLLLTGWLLFAAALGVGILIGWAIWGH